MSKILAYYEGTGSDFRGRRPEDVWQFTDRQLEAEHDYIQWLFPTRRPSAFQPAPPLDEMDVSAFLTRPELRERLLRSLDVMLAFYGFARQDHAIVRAPAFTEKTDRWLVPGDHNHLRITRILDSLRTLGLGQWSLAFFAALSRVYVDHPRDISTRTFEFWREAAGATDIDLPGG